MGYCSDVGLCLTDTGRETLNARLAVLEPDTERTKNIHELLNYPHDKRETDGAVAWLWESLKWYDDYPEVAFMESLLQDLDEQDYLLIRVGESDDDTEYRGGFWENPFSMCLVRGIAFG